MKSLLLGMMLALPSLALAQDEAAVQKLNERAAAQMEALRREDAAEKRELQTLMEAPARDPARLSQLFDQILSNGSRAAAVQLEWAREMRRLLTPEQFAKLVLAHSGAPSGAAPAAK